MQELTKIEPEKQVYHKSSFDVKLEMPAAGWHAEL